MEQLIRFEANLKLPSLSKVCISAHFTTLNQLETYIEEGLPGLDYLEISSVVLPNKSIVSCSKRMKQLVLFGTREYSHEELNVLASELGGLPLDTRLVYARDFPYEAYQSKADLQTAINKTTAKRKIPRKPCTGEIKYKQVCITNRETNNQVIILFRP